MEKVSLHSKSNTSLTIDPALYPKDLDPFGEDDEVELNETPKSVRSSVIDEQSYPSTFDPFADDEEVTEQSEVKSKPRKSRASLISNEKNGNLSDNKTNGANLNTSINAPVSDYDESLDPFGGDEDNNSKIDYRKSTGSVKETQKPAILADTNSESNISNINDNLSIQSEIESSELARRSGEERDSYSNQNSPVPVPPRRKHRNVSPSTKSLNRASYSASSLERTPSNGISSPISQNPNRLSAAETDTYLSHSISNLSTRSTSPIITVRSSPIRSRKKRRAPEPPGFPPSGSAASPITPNSSLVLDNSFNSTIESRHEAANESITEPSNESKIQTISEPIAKSDNEPTSGEIKEQAPDLSNESVSIETSGLVDSKNDVPTSEEIKESTYETSDEPASIETIGKTSVQNDEPTSEETREKTSKLSDESCSTETSVQSTKSDNDTCSLKTCVKAETNNEHSSEDKNGQTLENSDLESSESIVEQTPESISKPNCVPASESTNEEIHGSVSVVESSKDSNDETSKDGVNIKPNLDSTKPNSEPKNSQEDAPNSL